MVEIKASRNGEIHEIKVGVGDPVKQNQEMMIIESPELITLILSSDTGTVEKLSVKVGDRVSAGQVLAWVKTTRQ